MNQFLHFVTAITFFCMSAKHNVSYQSTFYTALKTLEKSTHFMLTHVIVGQSWVLTTVQQPGSCLYGSSILSLVGSNLHKGDSL